MARDDWIFTGTNYFVNGDNWAHVAVKYETAVADSLGSVYVHLNDPSAGDTIYAMVWDDNGGEPGTLLGESRHYMIDAGTQEYNLRFSDTLGLAPGTYYFGVYEASFSSINLSQAANVFTPGVNFFRIGGGNWNASSIPTTRVIRPQFDWDVVDCSQFDVSINQTPSGAVTEGDSVTLATGLDNSHTFQWKLNTFNIPGAVHRSYTFAADVTGTYSVEVIDRDSCMANDAKIVSVQPAIGINETENVQLELAVYPNPANQICVLDFNKTIDLEKLVMIDAVGNEMPAKGVQLSSSQMKLNLKSLNAGLYFVELVSTTGESARVKIVKW